MNRFIWPAFLVVVIAQWLVPVSMIRKNEVILRNGKEFKFLTAPIDPEDPFRGKYITLDFKENGIKVKGDPFDRGEEVYVSIINKNGYAKVVNLSKTKPGNIDFLSTKVDFVTNEKDSSKVFLDYPFNRFYMEESKAPAAESIYRSRNLNNKDKTYALVSILDGKAVVKNIYINDSTIADVIKNSNR